MTSFVKIFSSFANIIPLLILFFLSFGEMSFSYDKYSYLSFNIIHIVIFYWVLKNPEILGYGFIFLAGIVNDVVLGQPIGVSPFTFLILSGFASYTRYLTVVPSLIYDWLVFLPSIAVTNSLYYYILKIFFNFDINYFALASNTAMTFILYPIFGFLFGLLLMLINKGK